MNTFSMTGTVIKLMDPQTFSSGFAKREFIVQTDDKYPQAIKFECVKERMLLLDKVHEGDVVAVEFRIRGSEYNGKYFVNLQAIGLAPAGDPNTGGDEAEDGSRLPPEPPSEAEDSMPF